MITTLASLAYLILIFMLGYFVLSIVTGRSRQPITFVGGMSFGLGAGSLATLLFWLSLIGIRPGRITLALIGSGVIIVAFILVKRQRFIKLDLFDSDTFKRKNTAEIALVAMMLLLELLVLLSALAFPLYNWDAVSIWGFKAKVLFYEPVLKAAYFHMPTKSFSHLDYPLLQPFIVAGHYAAMGEINDGIGKFVLPLFYGALILSIYWMLRHWLSSRQAIILSALYAALPILLREAGGGTADVTLTFYYAGSVFFLVRWIEHSGSNDFILSVLFAYFCLFTKNEGLALGGVNLIVLFLDAIFRGWRKGLIRMATYMASLLILSTPWLIFRTTLPKVHEDYWGLLSLSAVFKNMDRLVLIISTFLRQVWNFESFGCLLVTLLLLAIIGWRGWLSRTARLFWYLIALHTGLYGLAFMITPSWEGGQFLELCDRLFLHMTPVMLLLIGLHWRTSSIRTLLEGEATDGN
jgi:hypothetical protein